MPKVRCRKGSSFESSVTKSVFLYGNPNKGKLTSLKEMQDLFTTLVNQDIQILSGREDLMLQLVKNNKKDSQMRKLEKLIRIPGINSAFCQNAFDTAVTHLSNRLDNIRLDLFSEGMGIFAQSKVLFAMSVMGFTKEQMIQAMDQISYDFHRDCANMLRTMDNSEFLALQYEFADRYASKCLEYKIPRLRSASVPLDSRLMKIEQSKHIVSEFVISITDPVHRNHRITVPLSTSRHSMHKIQSNQMAGTVTMQVRKGKLRIGWSYTKHMQKPETDKLIGVDVGITDALHTDCGLAIGSMTDPIDFYHKVVEPAFAEQTSLRNKRRAISHYLRTHSLSKDVRCSLIQKMDRLTQMIQSMNAPYRKTRHYYNELDHVISNSVKTYIRSIDKNTTTVLERLDVKEFEKSRTQNGKFSTFARGKLQHRLMQELNWHGFNFAEVEPDYTSQICPVCSNLNHESRNGKDFTCTCCGYHDDADHVGAINIRARYEDSEVMDICKKYQYRHKSMQTALKMIYAKRHNIYLQTHAESVSGCLSA